jgi:HAD superfamily hydrolase (TIGR01484 family)
MRYHALATDYDGTLAHHGRVTPSTLAALERLKASGRRLVMVTGRELPELQMVFPELGMFDLVVAENGALLYRPSNGEERALAEGPGKKFVSALVARGVAPMSVGRAIVATWEPHEKAVLETIQEQGLELQVIFNKGAVMVLPSGVNKASGLKAALGELGLSPHNVVGVGDAENDHAFLNLCGLSAAVANALPAVMNTADVTLRADHGDGVEELIDRLITDDCRRLEKRLNRRTLVVGKSGEADAPIEPHDQTVLICGASPAGRSAAAVRLLESLAAEHYQFCVFDSHGGYHDLQAAAAIGGTETPPTADEVTQLLGSPAANAIVNVARIPQADRASVFQSLLPALVQLRGATGRPHWVVLDDAQQMLPADGTLPGGIAWDELASLALVAEKPELLPSAALAQVTTLLAAGPDPTAAIESFCTATARPMPAWDRRPLGADELVMWFPHGEAPLRILRPLAKSTPQRAPG